jgi:hypothetical protein
LAKAFVVNRYLSLECQLQRSRMSKSKQKKTQQAGINIVPYLILIGLLLLPLIYNIFLRVNESDKQLISFSILAIIVGAIFEARRISQGWKNILLTTLAAFALSFFAFIPGKHEKVYDFDDHVTSWPYAFLFIFLITSMVVHDKKVTRKLDEGVTLIQSAAILYWIIDAEILTSSNLFLKILAFLGIGFSIFSFFHAFTYTKLSNRHRLLLSLGSSTIMILFAIDYTYRIYQNGAIEDSALISDMLYATFQYVLLGVSSIYMVHNLFMILEFLPDKRNFFNANHFQKVKELKKKHIDRYSASQLKVGTSALFLVLASGVFLLNNYFDLVPNHTAIWILFVSFPALSFLQNSITKN